MTTFFSRRRFRFVFVPAAIVGFWMGIALLLSVGILQPAASGLLWIGLILAASSA